MLTPLVSTYDMALRDRWTLCLVALRLSDPRVDHAARMGRLLESYRQLEAFRVLVNTEVEVNAVLAAKMGRIDADGLGRVNQIVAPRLRMSGTSLPGWRSI